MAEHWLDGVGDVWHKEIVCGFGWYQHVLTSNCKVNDIGYWMLLVCVCERCVCVLSHKPLSREEKTETDQARRMQAVPGLRRIKAFGNVCFSVSYCKACFLGSLQTNVTTMDSMFHLL